MIPPRNSIKMSDVITKKDLDELRKSLSDVTTVVNDLASTVPAVHTSDWTSIRLFQGGDELVQPHIHLLSQWIHLPHLQRRKNTNWTVKEPIATTGRKDEVGEQTLTNSCVCMGGEVEIVGSIQD